MISISLKKDVRFKKNNHLGIFYAVLDIYSNIKRPVNDTEMVNLLHEKYNINIERRTIKRYRDFIIDNFDIVLTYKKKGYFIEKPITELDLKINKINEVINSNNRYLNIKYLGVNKTCIPIKIIKIEKNFYLLCVFEKVNKTSSIVIISIDEFELLNPSSENVNNKPGFDDYFAFIEHEGPLTLPKYIQIMTINEEYNINAKMILYKNTNLKLLKEEAIQLFSNCKVQRVKRNNKYYNSIFINGNYMDIIKFVIDNRKLYFEINNILKEEVTNILAEVSKKI